MKKIPTLFIRVYENHKIKEITPKITPGMEWVLEQGVATEKIDGSCCAIINGNFYVRYDAKKGKPVPENAIKCQDEPDPITGHFPCWIPYDKTNPSQKWFGKAFENTKEARGDRLPDGTYEAVGKHFNGNPYGLNIDKLIKHGIYKLEVPRTFEGIKEYLFTHNIEGIVFWFDGEPKCKIKRSDFGFSWPVKGVIKDDKWRSI